MEGASQWQILEPSPNIFTVGHFDQIESAFCTSECFLDIQQDDVYEIAAPCPSSLQLPRPQSSRGHTNTFDESSLQTILEPYTRHLGTGFSASSSSESSGSISLSKKRMKWTRDLHDKFVRCVDCLGGAAKAKPKEILKMMESKGLTIFNVKSHLQKYRSEKYIAECKQGKPTISDGPDQLYIENSMKIKEALQLQLNVEKHLCEQLEIQRNLQLQIEENGRLLKVMLEQQQKTNKSLC